MNIAKYFICASLFLIVNTVIGSSSSSDDSSFEIWAAIQPIRQTMLDNYNYEVSMKAQKIKNSIKLTDFLADAYSEEKKIALEQSITQVLKDQYYNGATSTPRRKINKTLPTARKQKSWHASRKKQRRSSSSSSIDQ